MSLGRDLTRLLAGGGGGGTYARGQVVIEGDADPVAVIRGVPTPVRALGGVEVKNGDPVLCLYLGDQWYVLGVTSDGLPAVAAPPPEPEPAPTPTNPKPPAPITGDSMFTAVDSGTFTLNEGQWNRFHGRHLVQGSWSGRSYLGAWWYGSKPGDSLDGRIITRAEVRLPARYRLGNYNAAAVLHLRYHTQTTRGGRPVVSNPHDVALPAGFGGGWRQIPTGWGQTIVDAGGGIAIQGEPYAGFIGAGAARDGYDPASGQLRLWWER